VSVCDQHQCSNNGTCVVGRNGGVECICQPGYGGNNCQVLLEIMTSICHLRWRSAASREAAIVRVYPPG